MASGRLIRASSFRRLPEPRLAAHELPLLCTAGFFLPVLLAHSRPAVREGAA